jgi:isopenicillin-N N-acyltransferase-like protein
VKEPVRFTVVEMQGSHYEMGRQHGAQCRDLIQRLVRRFDGLLVKPENREAGHKIAREAVTRVRAAAPELLEETEGIAAGAGLPFEDVFRLSCSQELNSWQGCMQRRAVTTVPSGCTTIAVRQRRNALVAWNMDWYRAWQPFIVLLHGRPNTGPRFMAFALAGSIGRPGISERVAVSANFLPYRADAQTPPGSDRWAGPGVPYSYVSRMLLQQLSTSDALSLLERTRRMACLNYTLGDSTGHVCCVETLPADQAVLEATEGFITHANSYHSPEFGGLSEEEQRQRDPRAHLARQRLRQRRKPLDRSAIYAAQRAHFRGQPTGVCVHGRKQRDSSTLLSFVADLQAGEIWAAYGPPCRHRFLKYVL